MLDFIYLFNQDLLNTDVSALYNMKVISAFAIVFMLLLMRFMDITIKGMKDIKK